MAARGEGLYSREAGRWQWHLVGPGPGQGGLGTTPVRESNPIARRDRNVRDGRPCVMHTKKDPVGFYLGGLCTSSTLETKATGSSGPD